VVCLLHMCECAVCILFSRVWSLLHTTLSLTHSNLRSVAFFYQFNFIIILLLCFHKHFNSWITKCFLLYDMVLVIFFLFLLPRKRERTVQKLILCDTSLDFLFIMYKEVYYFNSCRTCLNWNSMFIIRKRAFIGPLKVFGIWNIYFLWMQVNF
jgi:hypothetical protein